MDVQRKTDEELARIDAAAGAMAVVERLILELARPGWFGSMAVVLELHDGFVTIVRATGPEQVHKIARPRAA